MEFFTYLCFALIALAAGRRRISPVAGLLVLLAAVLLRHLGFAGLYVVTGLGTLMRCWLGFFTGVLAYQAHARYHPILVRYSNKLGWGLLAGTGVFLSLKAVNVGWDYLTMALFGGIIILLAVPSDGSLVKTFNLPPLRWLGKVSYSMYLSHELVLIFTVRLLMFAKGISLRHFPHHASLLISVLGLLFVGLTVALVLAVSHFTYKWIETPGRKEFKELAAKWFKRKPAGVAT